MSASGYHSIPTTLRLAHLDCQYPEPVMDFVFLVYWRSRSPTECADGYMANTEVHHLIVAETVSLPRHPGETLSGCMVAKEQVADPSHIIQGGDHA